MPILSARGGMSAGAYGWGVLLGGAAASFDSIQTLSGNNSSNTLTFSSIPQTYKHLQIRCLSQNTAGGSGNAAAQLYFNGVNTGTSYSWSFLQTSGGTPGASYTVSTSSITLIGLECYPGSTATSSVGVIDILDYASTSKNKTIRYFGGANGNETGGAYAFGISSGTYVDTTAITSISIKNSSGTAFANMTRFALYGIKEST